MYFKGYFLNLSLKFSLKFLLKIVENSNATAYPCQTQNKLIEGSSEKVRSS
jgi:hypothetical protein